MRVIAGKYKGKLLKEFNINSTRPTLDRVKEAIFSSIQFDLANAVVLDLFSGTGALGIEAISRGANKVIFVDRENKAINLIKENLNSVSENYKIVNSDYKTYLASSDEKYDIILLDPPFNTSYGEDAIDILIKNDRINDGGVIIFEKSYDKDVVFDYPNYVIKTKKYGSVSVVSLRKV